MIKIRDSAHNRKVEIKIEELNKRSKRGLELGAYQVGKNLVRVSRRKIIDPPKTGRFYLVEIRGQLVRHRASAAGEPPANMTGDLQASLKYLIGSGNKLLEFSAGNGRREMDYAKTLEEGQRRVERRPYMITTIRETRKDTINYFTQYIDREYRR